MDMVEGMTGRCLFAIPKKGRLYERCVHLLKKIDVHYVRKNRLDIALCTNLNLALLFLPAADIARYVGDGKVDIGITGQDVVAESEVQVNQVMELEFGLCKLCVQSPKSDGITDVKQFIGKRIVTSFPNLSNKFFHKLDPNVSTHVTTVSGSVEVACALGLADAIVDLVESGETMRAAGLKIVDLIMNTQAVLIANPKSQFTDLISKISKRLEGVIKAEKYVVIEFNIEKVSLHQASLIVPGQKAPTISTLEDSDWVAVKSLIPATESYDKMEQLETVGARDIFITKIDNCRV